MSTATKLANQLNVITIWHQRFDIDGSFQSDSSQELIASLIAMGCDETECTNLSVNNVTIVAEIGCQLLRALQRPNCYQKMENAAANAMSATHSTRILGLTLSNLNITLIGLQAAFRVCFIWDDYHRKALSIIKEFAYQTISAYCSGHVATQLLPSPETVGHVISTLLNGLGGSIWNKRVHEALNLLLNCVHSRPFRLLLLMCKQSATRVAKQLVMMGNFHVALRLFGNPDDFPATEQWVDYTPWVSLAEGCRSVSVSPELPIQVWEDVCNAISVVGAISDERKRSQKDMKYLTMLVAAGGLCGSPANCRYSILVPTMMIESRIKKLLSTECDIDRSIVLSDESKDQMHVFAADAIALSFAASQLSSYQQHASETSFYHCVSFAEREAAVIRLCQLLINNALTLGPIQNDDETTTRNGLVNMEEDCHIESDWMRWFPLLFFSGDMAQATGMLMGSLSIPSIDNDVGAAAEKKKARMQRWVMSSLLHCMEAMHRDAK